MVPMLVDAGHDVVGLDSSLFVECTFGLGVRIGEAPSELSRNLTAHPRANVIGIYTCGIASPLIVPRRNPTSRLHLLHRIVYLKVPSLNWRAAPRRPRVQ